jgi:hypothetical protein
MKRYLNVEEKNQVAILNSFVYFMENCIDKWHTLNRDKKLLKNARMAKTWTVKAIKTLLESLDNDEKKKVNKYIKRMHVVVRTKPEAQRELQRLKELDSTVVIDREDFINLCSFAIFNCMECTKKDYKNCKLRDILMDNEIDPMDEYAEPTQCQYQYKDIKENAVFNVFKHKETGELYRIQPGLKPKGFELVATAPLEEKYWTLPKIITD